MTTPSVVLDMAQAPYDEDQIVHLVSEIYRSLLRLDHCDGYQVVWPPEEGHQLEWDPEHADLVGLPEVDHKVVSLLRRLPMQVPHSHVQALHRMKGIDSRNTAIFHHSRSMGSRSGPRKPIVDMGPEEFLRWSDSKLDPEELLLFDGADFGDACLVLSTKDNTVRIVAPPTMWDGLGWRIDDARRHEIPEDHHELPGLDAVSWLQDALAKLHSGFWVTDFNGAFLEVDSWYPGDTDEKLRRVLIEECKWPTDEFNRDEWMQRGRTVVDEVITEWQMSVYGSAGSNAEQVLPEGLVDMDLSSSPAVTRTRKAYWPYRMTPVMVPVSGMEAVPAVMHPQHDQRPLLEALQEPMISSSKTVSSTTTATASATGPQQASSTAVPSRTAYDEDRIVDLISKIYRTLLRQGHCPDDQVIWPPEGGHELIGHDTEVVIEETVLSLLRRLPVQPAGGGVQVHKRMVGWDFRSLDLFKGSRDMQFRSGRMYAEGAKEIAHPRMDPSDVLLFDFQEWEDTSLILSTKDNTVREFRPENLNDLAAKGITDVDDQIDYSSDYLNWPSYDAVAYLQDVLDGLLSGSVISDLSGGLLDMDDMFPDPADQKLRRLLIDECKWPNDDFDQEAWLAKAPAVVDASWQVWEVRNGWSVFTTVARETTLLPLLESVVPRLPQQGEQMPLLEATQTATPSALETLSTSSMTSSTSATAPGWLLL